MSLLLTILALGFVVFIHELGHLLAAKRARVGVTEFAVGMGPKLVSIPFKGTMYSIRLLPVGGFVKVKGLDETENCPIEEDYREKTLWARSSIIVAGSLFNIILGFVIFMFIGLFFGKPMASSTIEKVMPDMPAHVLGLAQGDIITHVNMTPVTSVATDIIQVISQSNGESVLLAYERNGAPNTVTVSPIQSDNGKYIIGVVFGASVQPLSLWQAVTYGVHRTGFTIGQTFVSLNMLFTGKATVKDLAGPVGIVQIAAAQLHTSFFAFLGLMAFISISLGVINLFPLPVLDGGHLVFLAIEGVRGRPLNKKAETIINNVAATLLIGLMVFIVFNDVVNWSSRVDILKEVKP
jgi:regulator of sigma E protease